MRPYKEISVGNISYRTFSSDIPEEELVWHRDREDRTIEVIENTDWKFQYEDELPMPLTESCNFFVPKGLYHRVVKGQGTLKVKVIKY